tara:strand:+ start:1779 stop:2615 length:837 start_codon:yes stop_codon:yes gene_type:complete
MTRVNTLKDIEAIYVESLNQQSKSLLSENQTVGKQTAGEELEDEKKSSKDLQKSTGPEAAENFDKNVNEAGGSGKRDEKNHYSTGKTSNESINNNKMQKKQSIFDKLYEDVLGGDDDEMEMSADFGDAIGDDEYGDEDETEDEVTLSLPRDVAQKLCDILNDQLADDEDIEDIEDTEEFDDEDDVSADDMFREGPDVQEIGDAGPAGSDLDKGNLKGKGNKVKGKGPAHKSSRNSSGSSSLKGGKAEPSELGDKSATLTGKNNKVPGKVRGHGQELMD